MANNTQDVELRIRATNLSKQTTDKVVASLNELTKAQDKQIDSAKRGATTAAELEKGYNQIEAAAKALVSQGGLVKLFEAQSKATVDAKARLDGAREALNAFANSLDPAVAKTRIQEATLKALSKSVTGAEKAYTAMEAKTASTAARLAQVGIASTDTAAAQAKINAAVTSANAALERQEAALGALENRQRRLKAVEDARKSREAQIALDNAFARAQEDVAKALRLEAEAQREANNAEMVKNRQRQVKVDVEFANAQRQAAEEINRKTAALNAQNAAMRAAADIAERQMRSTAGAGRGQVPVQSSNLSSGIRSINDPAAAAISNVRGLEQAIESLETKVSNLRGPVQGYRESLQQVTAMQRQFQQIAGQVDTYNRQIAALRAARSEYSAARAAVAALVAEMRSGAAGDDVTTRLRQAQSVLASSTTQMRNLSTAARSTRDALREAGVDTANMATAEQNLTGQATRAAAALGQLNAQFRRHGEAAENSNRGLLAWLTSGRNTVSYAQRIKGELIALTTAYIGLNAAIEGGKSALDTYSQFQALNSRLLVSAKGDQEAARKEFEYLAGAADHFGFVLLDIGNAYAKFSIAAKTAGFTTDETRYVFEQFAKAARNARLSTQEFDGILKAVEQMMSKGTIQAEELRGQLGDRLPGAFAIAAQAAGKTVAEYSKMMELGKITSDEVLVIARGVGQTYGQIGSSAETLNQAQARFRNAADKFKDAIAERGFADAYMEFLKKLTDIISGDNGDKLASSLAEGFKSVLQILTVLAQNMDTIILFIKVIIGLSLSKWALGAAQAIGALRVAFLALNTQIRATAASGVASFLTTIGTASLSAAGGVTAATAAVGLLRTGIMLLLRAIPYVGLALAAWSVLSFAWDKFFNKDDAVKAGTEAGKAGAKAAAGAAFKETAQPQARDRSYENYEKGLKDQTTAMNKLEEERLDILRQGNKKNLAERLKYVDQSYDIAREEVRNSTDNATVKELRLADIQDQSLKAQANERLRYNNEMAQSEESAGKKRERLALEISTKLKEIEDDLSKRSSAQDVTRPYEERRKARIEAIGHAYDDLSKKIVQQSKLDAPAAAAAQKRLDVLTAQRKIEEGITSDREEANRLLKEFNALQDIQKSQLDAVQNRSVADGPEKTLAESNRIIAETGPAIEEAGQRAIDFANSVRQMLDPVDYQRLLASVGKGMSEANVDAVTSMNNLNATEAQMNALLAQQKIEIDQITLKRKLGMISQDEEARLLNENTEAYKSKLLDVTNTYLQLLEIARSFGAISEEAYAKAKAGADNLITSTNNASAAFGMLEEAGVNSFVNNAMTAFDSLGRTMANVVMGTESIGDGFKAAGRAAAQFVADLLRDLAMAIAKQLLLNAIASSFGGSSGIGGAAVKLGGVVSGQHTGGVTGRNASFKRRVDMSMFAGAPKYHTGGIAGLAPNEVPAILQRNEEVLTRDDPRHILNGGGGGGGESSNRFVLVDDRSKVAEAMRSAEGEQVTLINLKRNLPTLKQWLKS